MSDTDRPARLAELRQALQEDWAPSGIVLLRRANGVLLLRVLSAAFHDVDDPLADVELKLAARGLRLPDRTVALLKSPAELEDGEETLFEDPARGTPTWADALEMEDTGEPPQDDRDFGTTRVIAFWGVKGGVGRTTTLAHVATLLGRAGLRVLAIDLDLDSPGLVAVLCDDAVSDEVRFDSLVIAAQAEDDEQELSRGVERALKPAKAGLPRLDVLGPACADDAFVRSLLGPLHPDSLYRGPRPALRRLLRLAIQAARANVVLLDARSGYCEESAIAVLDLADEVVVFAPPSPGTFPSLAPALNAIERRCQATGRPTVVHIAAGMLPAGEDARERILHELEGAVESARERVADQLQVQPRALPADLGLVKIDYSARIVENDGGLMVETGGGYRELAERILGEIRPKIAAVSRDVSLVKMLLQAEIPVPQAEAEESLERLVNLFTRTPDIEMFSRLSSTLVLGAKGTGKTFLRRLCLERPDKFPGSLMLEYVNAFSLSGESQHLLPAITQETMIALDKNPEHNWRDIWSIIATLRVLEIAETMGISWVHEALDETNPRDLLDGIAKGEAKSLKWESPWSALDSSLGEIGATLVFVFDDLDIALGRGRDVAARRDAMLVGLLDRAQSSWLNRKNIRVKIFLREDIFRNLDIQDRSKLEATALKLSWRPEDIWRLVVRAMAVGSPPFRAWLDAENIPLDHLEDGPEDYWRVPLALLWGERQGASEGSTRTLAWAQRRLSDGLGRMFPRAALWLLSAALKEQKRLGAPAGPPLLTPAALRAAMPIVSNLRLGELQNEVTEAEWARILRLRGFRSFMPEAEFLAKLKKARDPNPDDALDLFSALGFIERTPYKRIPHVRIVDLYAFASDLKIDRVGRR